MTDIDVEDYAFRQAQQLALVMPLYRLTTTQYDVWNTLLGFMEHGGVVPIGMKDIATRLNIATPNVSNALARLRTLGLVWRLTPEAWQINPHIAFKGSVEEWNEAMARIPEDVPEVPMPDHKVRPPRRKPNLSAA